jgi:hypothetical protein
MLSLTRGEPTDEARLRAFFADDLPSRTPPGLFPFPPGRIADGGLTPGEMLLFSFLGRVRFVAKSKSGRMNNTGLLRDTCPFCVVIDLGSVRAVDCPVVALDRVLRQQAGLGVSLLGQGWTKVPDTEQTERVVEAALFATTVSPPACGVVTAPSDTSLTSLGAPTIFGNNDNTAVEANVPIVTGYACGTTPAAVSAPGFSTMSTTEGVEFTAFRDQWLSDVTRGNPSTVELGRRFSQKLIQQWRDVDDSSPDLVYCDGAGDGGIDIAYLDRGAEDDDAGSAANGNAWYLVQSKYGSAFQGNTTLLVEGQKVIDTLDGRRPRLSSLAAGLLERLTAFRSAASEHDRIVLLFATELPVDDAQKRALEDLRAMGRARLGGMFEVESLSIQTIFERTLEETQVSILEQRTVPLAAALVASGPNLLVGSTSLTNLHQFLHAYRDKTQDLDQLYEKNVRRFLGARGKVNKAMQETLRTAPDQFGLYNNGITIVVTHFEAGGDGRFHLVDPYIVNGCQTTRTVWEVCHARLDSGATGSDPGLDAWRAKAEQGVVVTKVVKVGSDGEALLQAITRYTNSQNAVREKDFLALTSDFKTWAGQVAERYGVYLEIQRGAWDSRRALQKQRSDLRQFSEMANAFELLKVYGAGWLGEAGLAFGKNAPFIPNGTVFKRIISQGGASDGEPFGADDLYAAYLLRRAADEAGFGRGATEDSRRQTRFIFFMVVVELLREVLSRAGMPTTSRSLSGSVIRLWQPEHQQAQDALVNTALELIGSYLTKGGDTSLFEEPAYKTTFFFDLNAFLKWERLGKTEADTPRFRALLTMTKLYMGHKMGGKPSHRDVILAALKR